MGTEEKQERLGIEREIHEWRIWIIVFALVLLISYFLYFHLYLGIPASKEAGSWAEFGDFFGGILNPLVAFAAFYWLTQSVKLQKIELAETRRELEASARAQEGQFKASQQSVRIAAITALVNSIELQIEAKRNESRELKIPAPKYLGDRNHNSEVEKYMNYLSKIANECDQLEKRKNKLLEELEMILIN